MSKIKFENEIKELIEKRNAIPDEFWVKPDATNHRVIWFMDRQKPSVAQSYDFDMERFGLTKEGKIIWGFDSGCSCPSPFEGGDYNLKEWKEFEVEPKAAFDEDWEEECYSNLKDYLLLVKAELTPSEVLSVRNSEIRRFLIKRIGYENIRKSVGTVVLHTDGDSELLELEINGEKERYVKVKDSSTDREYLLYVPNNIQRCKEGIAWTFGLREHEYNPLIET